MQFFLKSPLTCATFLSGMSIAGFNSDEYLMLRILRTIVNDKLIKEFEKLQAQKNKQIYVRMNRTRKDGYKYKIQEMFS